MRTLVIGLDAFDPNVCERLLNEGKLPNLGKYLKNKGYARFTVANPPQSEVSWTSIATGLNPGDHGIFDFVHRDPSSYLPIVSLLPTKQGIGGMNFVPPFSAPTVFDWAVRKGYPATALWWPATFPARPASPVRTIPGLGTPDVFGRLGVGTFFNVEGATHEKHHKTAFRGMQAIGANRFKGIIDGPSSRNLSREKRSEAKFTLTLDGNSAKLAIGATSLELTLGEWSPILEIPFKGTFWRIPAITRVILKQSHPSPELYFLPFQLHPLRSPWAYGTPKSFLKQTWQYCEPFLSLGWPQDTTALEEGYINDRQFLNLCESIEQTRENVLLYHLKQFREGILAVVFDSLDRIQHMFWRYRDDVITNWYIRMDSMIGRIQQSLLQNGLNDTHLIIVSDHGFTSFDYKVHINRWLIERGYLVPLEPKDEGDLSQVNWSKTRAYAVGLNSLYINLAGREGIGIVEAKDTDTLLQSLCEELKNWIGPNGNRVVRSSYTSREAFKSALPALGPDLLIGYSPGYRASQDTGLGKWGKESILLNNDHWSGDHCVDSHSVPGIIFANNGLQDLSRPSYEDIPALILGSKPKSSTSSPPSAHISNEDREIVEERLKGLGYL